MSTIRPQNDTILHSGKVVHSVHNHRSERESAGPLENSGPSSYRANLASPSTVVARAYFGQCKSAGINYEGRSRRKSSLRASSVPRRHSAITTKEEITAYMGHSPNHGKVLESRKLQPITSNGRTIVTTDTKLNEISAIGTIATMQHTENSLRSALTWKVPFQYTHDRLRTWGHAYLGNIATADAFVNAVSLRRPSLIVIKEESAESMAKVERSSVSADLATIRARVIPKAVERKPFLIQRRLNIQELRDSIPVSQADYSQSYGSAALRRSSRLRRLSLQPSKSPNRVAVDHQLVGKLRSNHMGIPIHIEYALHYLPVLAALMLSGHVRKGDSIDLPLPHPQEWIDTIAYVYTGTGDTTSAMEHNIRFLAGRA